MHWLLKTRAEKTCYLSHLHSLETVFHYHHVRQACWHVQEFEMGLNSFFTLNQEPGIVFVNASDKQIECQQLIGAVSSGFWH